MLAAVGVVHGVAVMSVEGKLRVYLINLDRSRDRLERFMADNAMPDLEIVRFPAVDGSKLDRTDLVSRGVIAGDLLYSNNAVACSLSHLAIWRQIIADGRPAVVCEDDAILRKDFAKVHAHFAAVRRPVGPGLLELQFRPAHDLRGAGPGRLHRR